MRLNPNSPGTLVGVVSTDPYEAVTTSYKIIITKMLDHADNILASIETAKGDRTKLADCITALHSLTHSARQFSLPASVKFATDRGDFLALEVVCKHPILGPILHLLNNTNVNGNIYIDWTLTVYTEGLFKQKIVTKLDYTLTNQNPYVENNFKDLELDVL